MLDALIPFARTFADRVKAGSNTRDALFVALNAVKRGAEDTARLVARRGRSSYLGARALDHPDPGAMAVSIWLEAAISVLTS